MQHLQKFNTISKTCNDILIVWFCNSASFILFEQPASEVFTMLQDEVEKERIIAFLKDKYNYSKAVSSGYVTGLAEKCNYYNKIKINNKKLSLAAYSNFEIKKIFTEITYRFNNRIISVAYGNKLLYNIIHPLFSHLQTGRYNSHDDFLELTEYKKNFLLNCNGSLIEHFKNSEHEFFKGAVLKQFYSLIHRLPDEQWMMTIHASGVTWKNKAVLFVADSGGGKSTLAALLVAHGYKLLSDDFIAVDTNAMAYPFPAGITVKNNAMGTLLTHFPELNEDDANIHGIGNSVKYIPNYSCKSQVAYKIQAVIFLKYETTNTFVFRKITAQKALPLFLKQSWIVPEPDRVKNFLDWFPKTTFYNLNYSGFEDVNCVIKQIFRS